VEDTVVTKVVELVATVAQAEAQEVLLVLVVVELLVRVKMVKVPQEAGQVLVVEVELQAVGQEIVEVQAFYQT
jgi:hypothetical protein